MSRVLKFEEYVQINEVYSSASFGDVWKTLKQFGWTYHHSTGGDNVTFIYKDRSANGHLKHGHSDDWNRKVDPEVLDRIRDIAIDDFYKNGNPKMINHIPWERWCSAIKDPFKSVLKDYDRETGLKKSELEMLNKITVEKQLFKNVWLIKNEDGEYNLCRSEQDKTPLLDRWYPIYDYAHKLGGKMCLGYDIEDLSEDSDGDSDVEEFGTHKFVIKPDGTLGSTKGIDYVVESVKKS